MSRNSHQYLSVLLVAIIGYSASFYLFSFAKEQEQERFEISVFNKAKDHIRELKSELESSFKELDALAAFYHSSYHIEWGEFADFSRVLLSNNARILAFEWAPKVSGAKRDEFEQHVQNDGFPGFHITERDAQGNMIRAGRHDVHFPVQYIEPFNANESAHGYDLASNPDRMKGILAARDSGEIYATERVILAQGQHTNQIASLALKPVYQRGTVNDSVEQRRKNLIGFVLALFIPDRILDEILEPTIPKGLDIHIFDISAPADKQFLAFHASRLRDEPAKAVTNREQLLGEPLQYHQTVQVAGRQWMLIATPAPALLAQYQDRVAVLYLLVALLLVTLLMLYMTALIKRSERDKIVTLEMEAQVVERTATIAAANARLEHMQKVADALSHALTPDETLNNVIQATREIFQSDRAWLLYPCDPDATHWRVPVESTLPEYPGAFSLNQKLPMTPELKLLIQDALHTAGPVIYCPMPKLGVEVDQFAVQSMMMIVIRPKFGKPWLLGLHQCSHERHWSDEEQSLLQNVSIRISDSLSSLHLNRDLQKLSQAVQQAGEAVMITDPNAIIEYVNPAFTEITGYPPEEVLGKTPSILKSSAQDPVFYKELWDAISAGKIWHGTLIDKRKDGSFYPSMMSVAPIQNENNKITHYVSLQQDMTEYKKMEGQFLQAQKMEAIGTLVGGIAHDFNNMLAAIQGNVYLSRLKLGDMPEVTEKLDNIELLGTRAADMVKQLLTFARKDRVRMSPFSLNSFIKEAYKLAKTAVPENIELACDPCQEDLMITGDATQLQQALMNLLNNARDAVSDVNRPKVSCQLRPFHASEEFKQTHPEIQGTQFAKLIIRDNGSGIPKDHLNKIFEPFFTTKGVGEGTGLGLSMVYGTVQSHGGYIEAESEQGSGTAFSIYLPLQDGEQEITSQKDSDITTGAGETILLVDDEESVRSTTCEVLESLNYKVITASDGEQAMALFIAHQKEIDLILTDIVMPKLGGIDLAKSIRLLNQDVPIILATGYDKKLAIASADRIDHSIIVNKPFSIETLSISMQKMINPDLS